jgi:hypothetical protein
MNIFFHTITGLAATAALSSTHQAADPEGRNVQVRSRMLALGFTAGILIHGMLDLIPHSYPINSIFDLAFSLLLFFIVFLIVRRRYRILLGMCFWGSVLPDIVDLGPAILNKRLGWSLPMVKIFPWHWHQYSGSIYSGSRGTVSTLCHIAVIGISIALLCARGKQMFGRDHFLSKKHTEADEF